MKRIFCFAWVALSLTFIFGACARAADSPWSSLPVGADVAATTVSGRIIRGAIEARTTNDRLRIVAASEGITIVSELAAADVTNVRPAASVSLPAMDAQPMESLDVIVNDPRPSVKSLSVYASVENWDADAQADGLRLHLAPLNARGQLALAGGSLSIELSVRRHDLVTTRETAAGAESWSRQIAVADFGPDGAAIDLPFRSLRRESNPRFLLLGDLKVRLNVAGEGSFDAQQCEIPLAR